MFTHFTVTPRYIDQNAQLFLENSTTHVVTWVSVPRISPGILIMGYCAIVRGARRAASVDPAWTQRGPSVASPAVAAGAAGNEWSPFNLKYINIYAASQPRRPQKKFIVRETLAAINIVVLMLNWDCFLIV